MHFFCTAQYFVTRGKSYNFKVGYKSTYLKYGVTRGVYRTQSSVYLTHSVFDTQCVSYTVKFVLDTQCIRYTFFKSYSKGLACTKLKQR